MCISHILTTTSSNRQKIKNYIFQGGSVKGIAYIGALEELEQKGIKISDIKRMGGTSVGSITAALLSVGYDLNELKNILKEDFLQFLDIEDNELKQLVLDNINKDIKIIAMNQYEEKKELYHEGKKELQNIMGENFDNGKFWKYCNGTLAVSKHVVTFTLWNPFKSIMEGINECIFICKIGRKVMTNKGLAEGNKFLEWMEEKIRRKTDIDFATFDELYKLHEQNPEKYKQLYLIGGNATKNKSEVFSHEHTPDLIISDAVRISMSIPIVFKPHRKYIKINKQRMLDENSKNHLYIDGGVFDNYPIWLFDDKKYNENEKKNYNTESLGFKLEPFIKILGYEIQKGVLDIFHKNGDEETMENDEWNLINMDYFLSILKCFYNKQDSDFNHTYNYNKSRTIIIDDKNISTLKFNLDLNDKMQLIKSGKDDASRFLTNYFKALEEERLAEESLAKKRLSFNSIREHYSIFFVGGVVGGVVGVFGFLIKNYLS